ncbi:MAG: GNAT family N-acetyltransferase [Eubacteriales bacterium]|nr:GNAT family N-acetyltransferase [Eubacteriales bacterium]
MIRFLKEDEYGRTRALNDLCFPDEEFSAAYYDDGIVKKSRIAVKEIGGEIVSEAHAAPRKLWYRDPDGRPYSVEVPYIFCVATHPAYRHRGYMDEVLKLMLDVLREDGAPFAFLVPVDPAIYRHLGFVHDWTFGGEEAELLYADDGLTECSAKLLCAAEFRKPERITL